MFCLLMTDLCLLTPILNVFPKYSKKYGENMDKTLPGETIWKVPKTLNLKTSKPAVL